jgi:Family of unknown function (DUF6502)
MVQPTSDHKRFVERRSFHLLATTQRTLWPFVKLLLHRGIGYPLLAEALKSVFVGVAESEFPLEGKAETDSRISLLTGIHRRDVKRLREQRRKQRALAVDATPAPAGLPVSTEVSLSARVIAVWTGLPSYLDERGDPLPLPRLARKGGEHSFESLVQSLSKDTRPRALLDEWLRRGIVAIDEQDRVHLNLAMLSTARDLDQRAFYLGQNIHDHVAAIAHDLTGERPAFLEYCVPHSRLTEQSVAELAELARQETLRALQVVHRRATELEARDAGSSEARARINLGVYFYAAEGRASPLEARDSPAVPDA